MINNNKLIFINNEDDTQVKQLDNYNNYYAFGIEQDDKCAITLVDDNPFVISKFNNTIIKSQLIGTYNFNNISAAIAIGHYFEVSEIDIRLAIKSYIPENNRSQVIDKGSNRIILDAYNANPTSMMAALDNLNNLESRNKTAILGDMFELGLEAKQEHKNIADYAAKLNIDSIYLVGKNFYNANIESSNVQLFKTFEDLKSALLIHNIENSTILIKGSRGMALERILELI